MTFKLSFASIAAVVILFSSARLSAAPAEDPEALIREGVKLRRQGDHARAEGYFLRAYQIAATPRSAAQLGLVELALGEFIEAETHLSQALGTRDAWVSEHKQAIQEGRASARKHLVRVELAPLATDTTLSNAGAPATAAPADGVIFIAAGKPTSLRLEAPGHKPAVVQVEGAEGETRHVSVAMPALEAPPPVVAQPSAPPPVAPAPTATAEPSTPATTEPTPAPAPAAAADPGHGLRVAGIVAASVGVAVGIVGGVFLADARSKHDALQTDVNAGQVNADQFASRNDAWMSKRTLGIACAVSGGVALVGGAALFAVGVKERGQESTSVSFIPGPGFGLLSYRRSF